MSAFHVIIPARLKSSRLPGKLMLQVSGKSILEHVYLKACQSDAQSVTIAVDHADLYSLAKSFCENVMMTSEAHQSGTDRVAEAALGLGLEKDAIIVNVQGDEPHMPPELINQVAKVCVNTQAPLASLYWPIDKMQDWHNPNIVKVVLNEQELALYFSRSPIPFYRDQPNVLPKAYRHIGLYAYRMQGLQDLVESPMCGLEQFECLEQLRALYRGLNIQMQQALMMPGQDINTMEDFENLLKITE